MKYGVDWGVGVVVLRCCSYGVMVVECYGVIVVQCYGVIVLVLRCYSVTVMVLVLRCSSVTFTVLRC
jgi:hypothetical protein